jgi:hypothetical protein
VRKGAVPYLYFRHRVPVFVNHIKNKLPQNQARNGRQAQQMDDLNNARLPQNLSQGTKPPKTRNVTLWC